MNAMKNSLSGLSVVLPAFNEERGIAETIQKVVAYLKQYNFPFEIIVVNDGSGDHTKETVERLRGIYPQPRLINHPSNRGAGEAARSGFDAAKMGWILLMDSDGQFDIATLRSFLPHASKYNLIIGWRQNRADPFMRVFWTFVLNTFTNLAFRLQIKDVGCGFKLFRRTAWQAVQPIHSHDQKMFTVEWLWNSRRSHLLIQQIPVKHYPRTSDQPTGGGFSIAVTTLRAFFELRFRQKKRG